MPVERQFLVIKEQFSFRKTQPGGMDKSISCLYLPIGAKITAVYLYLVGITNGQESRIDRNEQGCFGLIPRNPKNLEFVRSS